MEWLYSLLEISSHDGIGWWVQWTLVVVVVALNLYLTTILRRHEPVPDPSRTTGGLAPPGDELVRDVSHDGLDHRTQRDRTLSELSQSPGHLADDDEEHSAVSRVQSKEDDPRQNYMRMQSREDRSKVLLVTAHPDDEAMFFGPSLLNLQDEELFLLCLSTGNERGLGAQRVKELRGSCEHLGISTWTALSDRHLQDGFDQHWDPDAVADAVVNKIAEWDIEKVTEVITFDSYGITGHPNHQATHKGVMRMLAKFPQVEVLVYTLTSVSLLRKYLGFADAVFSALDPSVCFVNSAGVALIRSAMREHGSQMVWYRKLYVYFSRYVYMNSLAKLDVAALKKRQQ